MYWCRDVMLNHSRQYQLGQYNTAIRKSSTCAMSLYMQRSSSQLSLLWKRGYQNTNTGQGQTGKKLCLVIKILSGSSEKGYKLVCGPAEVSGCTLKTMKHLDSVTVWPAFTAQMGRMGLYSIIKGFGSVYDAILEDPPKLSLHAWWCSCT